MKLLHPAGDAVIAFLFPQLLVIIDWENIDDRVARQPVLWVNHAEVHLDVLWKTDRTRRKAVIVR